MIDVFLLSDLFAETGDLLRHSTNGLTHDESVRRFAAGSPTINWVVGHIVAARANILIGFFDVPNRWDAAMLSHYITETASGTAAYTGSPFAQLLRELDDTQSQLTACLRALTSEMLQSSRYEQTLAAHLVCHHAHEAHHAGQLDILSQCVRAWRAS